MLSHTDRLIITFISIGTKNVCDNSKNKDEMKYKFQLYISETEKIMIKLSNEAMELTTFSATLGNVDV